LTHFWHKCTNTDECVGAIKATFHRADARRAEADEALQVYVYLYLHIIHIYVYIYTYRERERERESH
jgi:hypothetical protein